MPKVVDTSRSENPLDPEEIAETLRAELPKRLRRALQDRNWDAADLGARSGVTPEAVRRILRGEGLPSLPVCAALADALGLGRGQLAFGG